MLFRFPDPEAEDVLIPEGLTTFPLYPIVDGRCGCGGFTCPPKTLGKHPAVVGWTSLVASVTVPLGHGTGILTGGGLFVVDLDSQDAADWFFSTYLPPPTYSVLTGREGWGLHMYFRCAPERTPKNSASKLHPGVDVRGVGGYVVAEGSMHASGRRYVCVDSSAIATLA